MTADSSENSNQNQVKFGISIGEKTNSLNTVCLGNFSENPHPTPDILAKPEIRDITYTSVKNALCAGKFITIKASETIKNGQILSTIVDSNGDVVCIGCKSGNPQDTASQVLGVALEAGNAGDLINVAVSGYCSAIGLVPFNNILNSGSSASVFDTGGDSGYIFGNANVSSATASCGIILKGQASTSSSPTAPYTYLINVWAGHEGY